MAHALLSKQTLTVAVGSGNPCKVTAVCDSFEAVLEKTSGGATALDLHTYSASSGVSDQPMGDAETLLGAKNRARNAASMYAAANGGALPDFSVGLEGGIVSDEAGEMWCMAWMAVYCPSEAAPARQFGVAQTGKFPLPPLMAAIVNAGEELGVADDIVTKRVNSKQGGGTVGVLTDEIIPRGDYYKHALILAMTRFISADVFYKGVEADGVTVAAGTVSGYLAKE
jgi:inosine/xanthosine triphosphatase